MIQITKVHKGSIVLYYNSCHLSNITAHKQYRLNTSLEIIYYVRVCVFDPTPIYALRFFMKNLGTCILYTEIFDELALLARACMPKVTTSLPRGVP